MQESLGLSLEQQFELRRFSDQVQQLSQAQAQVFLVDLYKHMLLKEATYNQLLQKEWEISPGSHMA